MRNLAKRVLALINKGLAPIDALFMQDDDSATVPPLFIVGAPRSGTSLTYQLVTQQIRVGYFISAMNYLYGAPNLLMKIMKPFLGRPRPVFDSAYGKTPGVLAPAENGNFWFRWFPMDGEQGHYVGPSGLRPESCAEMKRAVDSMTRIVGRPMVFKSVYLSMTVAALARTFPQARFLFVRREAFFVCQSLLLARLDRPNPREWWSVKIAGYRSLLSEPIWRQVTDQVYHTDRLLERDLAEHASGRYLELRYEDLCRDPRGHIRNLCEWLGPVGFTAYADMRIPDVFKLSRDIRVSSDVAAQIKQRLRELNEGMSCDG
jgi:hypothetical protein